jgi:DNA-directed RNA polymerase subunit RPC12/RpoP
MWLICISCHHHAQVEHMPKGSTPVCTACGSRVARSVRVVKQHMLNGGQTEAGAARVLTYAGLVSIARERGYKVGWASMKYKAIFGEWPVSRETPEPVDPSQEVMWWVKKQSKEYAKARREAEAKAEPRGIKIDGPSLMTDEDWQIDL